MASKKHRPEEAVAKLRQVDVLVSRGQAVAEAIRAIGVTEVTDVLPLAAGVRRPEVGPGEAASVMGPAVSSPFCNGACGVKSLL